MTIVFIGAGNLATSLALALKRVGHTILQVYSYTSESAADLAGQLQCAFTTEFTSVNPDADVYFYAVRDDVYSSIPAFPCNTESVHLLTSGSIPFAALQDRQHRGIFYPFQTFSKQQPVSDFHHIPVMILGEDDYALSQAKLLAESISGKVYHSSEESLARLHLAGVLANNFSNCMYALAGEQLEAAGLPFDILLPLIEETAKKVHNLPPRSAQTGPASRKDKSVMLRQLDLLDSEEKKQIYRLISDDIIRHSI